MNVTDGTIVRFTTGAVALDVTITADNPTTRDFLSMLPLTLTFEEFNGREKISYLPRELDTAGSPGSDPEDGDLIYFVPWGNLGFYYNTDAAMGEHGDDGEGVLTDEEMAALETAQSPEVERLFLEGMIAHHEGAIAMAETELAEGQSADAKALAQDIIDAQQAEIDEMKNLMGTG